MTVFLKALWSQLFARVFLAYRSTLVGIGLTAAIVVLEQTTAALQALPQGWAQALALLPALIGASLKSKAAAPSASPPKT